MKKRSLKRNFLTILLAIMVFVCSLSTTTQAATNEPFGLTFADTANGRTIYRFYKHNSKTGRYVVAKELYSKSTKLFVNGTLVTSIYGSSADYGGFDMYGNFYVISPKSELLKVDMATNTVKTLLSGGCIRLRYNSDSIAEAVITTSVAKSLATLKPVPDIDEDDEPSKPSVKPTNRVEFFTNSADELVCEAYQNNKQKLELVISSDGSKVLNMEKRIRLTDTLKGAKFIGVDSSYNVYLYEGSSLYRFRYGKWYSAERIQLTGTYKSFKNDSNGFISKVVTTRNTYTIRQLTTSSKWKASHTYTVRKSGYVTLYRKGTSSSYTLQYKSGKLYLNGKLISSSVSKYGFTSSKAVFIKAGKCYTVKLSSPKKATKICSGARYLSNNSVGLVTKVKLTNGKYKTVK